MSSRDNYLSFYSVFRYTNQMREEQGLGSMAPGISRFLLRIVISLFIAAAVIAGLILFVYVLKRVVQG